MSWSFWWFFFFSHSLLLKLLKVRLKQFLGDKSVTMCGVAQEVTQEDDIEAYTKPWHVTVTMGTVRVLHIFYISKCVFRKHTHTHICPCSPSPVSDPS